MATPDEFENDKIDLIYHIQLPEGMAAKEMTTEWKNFCEGFELSFGDESSRKTVRDSNGRLNGNIEDQNGMYSLISLSTGDFWIEYTSREEILSAEQEQRRSVPSMKTNQVNMKAQKDILANLAIQIAMHGPIAAKEFMNYMNEKQAEMSQEQEESKMTR